MMPGIVGRKSCPAATASRNGCAMNSRSPGGANGTGLPLKVKVDLPGPPSQVTVGGAIATTLLISGYFVPTSIAAWPPSDVP